MFSVFSIKKLHLKKEEVPLIYEYFLSFIKTNMFQKSEKTWHEYLLNDLSKWKILFGRHCEKCQ